MSIKVSIIEDHKEYRESIAFILSATEGFSCAGKYESVENGINNLKDSDVLLLDIHLPGKQGTEAISDIKKLYPDLVIVMLTVFEDEKSIFDAIMEGADGYLLKKTSPIRLIQFIEDAYQGGTPLSPVVAKKALQIFTRTKKLEMDSFNLTPREMEVLNLIVQGFENREIADKLFISLETVRNHIRHIYEKLEVNSKTQAVVKALKNGLAELTN